MAKTPAPQSADPAATDTPEYTPEELQAAAEQLKKLTPIELIDMLKVIDSLTAGQEDGGLVTTELYGEHGGYLKMTAKGPHLIIAVDRLMDGVRHIQRKYGLGWKPTHPVQRAPAAATAPATPAPGGSTSAPPPPPGATTRTPPPPPLAGEPTYEDPDTAESNAVPGTVNTFRTVMIDVSPRPDGKADVKFFDNAHKQPVDEYPTVIKTATPEQLAKTFASLGEWLPDHFKAAARYNIVVEVDWVESNKKNTKGRPYKDITALRLPQ